MDAGASARVDADRRDHFGSTVAEAYFPAVGVGVVAGFDDAVVVWTGQYQVRQRGGTSGPPRSQVVGVARFGRLVAAREDTSAVAEFEGCPDRWGDQPL